MNQPVMTPLGQRIDAIEEAYEYMLAYAARGAVGETSAAGPGIRAFLERLEDALDGLGGLVAAEGRRGDGQAALLAFAELLETDAARALVGVRLVLAVPSIGSQIVDNLNASIHLRTLLTDLFLVDEALKGNVPVDVEIVEQALLTLSL